MKPSIRPRHSKNMLSLFRNTNGFALLGVLLFTMAVPSVVLIASELNRVVKDAERSTKSSQTKQSMNMIRDYLINNARDIDSNGQPDVPKEGTGNSLPASLPFSSTDMFGTAYLYCTWHVGPGNNTNAAYSQNNATPPKPGLIAKLISAGADKTFQTSCDDVNANGDDIAYETFNTSTTFVNNGWTAGAGNIFATGMSDMIGIGTNTPPSRVTIYDSANISDAQQQIRIGVAANRDYTVGRMSASGLMKFAGSEAGTAGYMFEANGIERFKIAPTTGNAQFGAPGADTGERVQVAGVIKTTDGTKMSKFGADVIAAGAIGIGSTSNHDFVVGANNAEVIRAGVDGTTTLSKSANSSAFGATGNLVIANPTGSQSQIQFTHAGTTNSTIRGDSSGNLVLNSRSGAIYLNYDTGATTQIYSAGNTIVLPASAGIGTAAGAFNLNVNGSTNTGTLYVAGNLLSDANRNIIVNSVDSAAGYRIRDTRAVNDAVGAYSSAVTFDMKLNAVIGNAGAGAYSTVMTLTPWMDDSAGGSHQVAYSPDGNIYNRYGTRAGGWGSWKRSITSNDVSGTVGYIPKFTGANSVGDSSISDDGAGHIGFNSVGTNRQSLTVNSVGNGSAYNDIVQTASDVTALGNTAPKSWTLSYRKDGYFTGATAGSYEFYGVLKDGSGYYSPLAFKADGDIILASPRNTVRSGSVVIGTTAPYNSTTDKLTVLQQQNATTQVVIDNQNSGASAAAGLALQAYGGTWQLKNHSSGTFTNPLTVDFNGATQVRFTSDGSIQAYGANTFNSLATGGNWGFMQGNYVAGQGGNVYNRGFTSGAIGIFNSNTTAQDIYLYNQNSPSAGFLVLKDSGYVGVGTVAPVGALESFSNSNWSAGWTHGITSTAYNYPTIRLRATNSGKISWIGNDNDGALWFGTNGSDSAYGNLAMLLTTSNGLLLNTTSQSSTGRVFIKDDSSFNSEWNSAGVVISNNTNNAPTLRMGTDSANGISYIQSMRMNVSWFTSPLVLQGAGGYVGIGTGAVGTSAKLHVYDAANAPATGSVLIENGGHANLAIKAGTASNYAYQTFFQGSSGKLEMGAEGGTGNFYMNKNVQVGSAGYSLLINNATGNIDFGNGFSTAGGPKIFAGYAFNSAISSSDTRTLALNGVGSSSMWWNGSGTPQFAIDSLSGGGAGFWVNNGSWSQAMNINSAGNMTMNTDRYTLYGPNSTWGATLRVGGNGNADNNASVVTTNGNLHLDAANGGFATYINFYKGSGGVKFGNGASATVANIDAAGNGSFTGGIYANGPVYAAYGSGGQTDIFNRGGEGAEILLHGANGVNYYIENINGVFRGINSPRTVGLWSFDQSGNLSANAANFSGVTAGGYTVNPNHGYGYGFWGTVPTTYGISMANYGAANAGQINPTNEYNMYFSMKSGVGRGFVFNTDNGNVLHIDGSGQLFTKGAIFPGWDNSTLNPQTSYYLYANTANGGLRTNGNFLVTGDIYLGAKGAWLSGWMDQSVATTASPTFNTIRTSNWFRSTNASGWYNEAYHAGIWSQEEGVVDSFNNARLRIIRNTPAINNSSYTQGNLELRTDDSSNPILGFQRYGFSAGAIYHSGYGTGSLRYRGADGVDGQILIKGVGETNYFVQGDNSTRTSDMSDPNARLGSGFYNMYGNTNVPYNNSWWAMINVRHTNEGNNYGMQFLGNFFNQGDLYYRIQNGDSFSGGWGRIWTQHNSPVVGYLGIGNGNSLRHTNPDGSGWIEIGAQNASWAHIQTDRPSFYFNKKVTVDTGGIALYNSNWSVDNNGYMTVNGGGSYRSPNYFYSNMGSGTYLGSSSGPGLQVYSNDGSAAFMSFHRSGLYAVNMGLDPDNVFRVGGWSAPSARMTLDMAGNLTTAGNISSSGNISAAGAISAGGAITATGTITGSKLYNAVYN